MHNTSVENTEIIVTNLLDETLKAMKTLGMVYFSRSEYENASFVADSCQELDKIRRILACSKEAYGIS